MSLVHDQLFKADTVTMIEMDRYLSDLALPDRADGQIGVALERDAEEFRITVTDSFGEESPPRRSLGLDIARLITAELSFNIRKRMAH
jgi:hypothetical protein